LHEHVDAPDTVLHRALRCRLGGELRCERRRLARTLEADVPARRPADRVTLRVGDRDDRVVERRLDVRVTVRDVLLLFALGALGLRHYSVTFGFSPNYFLALTFLEPATVFFGPFRVRALVCVRCPRTGRPRRWRIPW